ncbi:MAG: 2-oxo acid dehydrogenase subunit E2 [Ignavibacteria bacterium]|nr:2-oxo acid dehydrogenase subunit E2 [Ignavibacteria bacterium]
MTSNYKYHKIPKSRIATFDVVSIGMLKHHISALLEFDVTESRIKLKKLKSSGHKVSFNAWIIKVIGKTLSLHPEAAAYLCSKKKLITFDDINISIIVEKIIDDKRVPIPLVLKKTNEKTVSEITQEIENAKNQTLSADGIVLNEQTKFYERFYYILPGFLRRYIWKFMLKHPKIAFRNMGNAVITSLGMMGKINGLFIPKSVHPVCFGIGSVIKKPVVINDVIKIREILNMTILFDHDVIDGAPMVRFLKDLTFNIEHSSEL